MSHRNLPLVLGLALSLGACATQGDMEASTPGDPLEPVNRQVLDVNLAVDDAVLRPVALGYRQVVPEFARTGVRNALANMQEPRILANNILQGRLLDAGHTTLRFVFNSTIGLGGLFDVATDWGIERRTGDFGQTLHTWGVDGGPYVMLPLLGPSNTRDVAGAVGDGLLNPISWLLPIEGDISRFAVDGVDTREQNIEAVDSLRNESLDFYARLRSVWEQRRNAELARTGAISERIDVLDDPGTTR